MRAWIAFLALGLVSGCGGATQSPKQNTPSLEESCKFICQTATGQCPVDCQTQCRSLGTAVACGKYRVAFWYCAAKSADAVCSNQDVFQIATSNVSTQQCSSQLAALNKCVCANNGLVNPCGP